ncbi:MAG: alpha/beta hydrolase [Chloroflexi bacterium]|nr:alpha/beta hydrolase [Chloroflexota bacterium]
MKKRLWFRNAHGFYLVGDLLSPDEGAPYCAVVFAHELHDSRRNTRHLAVAERLLDQHIASLLFDLTGHGESQGQIEDATIDQLTEDLGSAVDRLLIENSIDSSRIGITGSGAGGTAAILRAATDKRIRALVLHNAQAGTLEVLEAADYVDVPTLLIVGELAPETVHENHALQMTLAGETRMEVVHGADVLFEGPGHLSKVVESSANWFSQRLSVFTRA